jgi:hypothetical protein
VKHLLGGGILVEDADAVQLDGQYRARRRAPRAARRDAHRRLADSRPRSAPSLLYSTMRRRATVLRACPFAR